MFPASLPLPPPAAESGGGSLCTGWLSELAAQCPVEPLHNHHTCNRENQPWLPKVWGNLFQASGISSPQPSQHLMGHPLILPVRAPAPPSFQATSLSQHITQNKKCALWVVSWYRALISNFYSRWEMVLWNVKLKEKGETLQVSLSSHFLQQEKYF